MNATLINGDASLINLHTNKKAVIFNILPILQGFDAGEFHVSIAFAIAWGCWSLKCQKRWSGYQGVTDVMFVLSVITLVKDRQGDSARKWPLQGVIPV